MSTSHVLVPNPAGAILISTASTSDPISSAASYRYTVWPYAAYPQILYVKVGFLPVHLSAQQYKISNWNLKIVPDTFIFLSSSLTRIVFETLHIFSASFVWYNMNLNGLRHRNFSRKNIQVKLGFGLVDTWISPIFCKRIYMSLYVSNVYETDSTYEGVKRRCHSNISPLKQRLNDLCLMIIWIIIFTQYNGSRPKQSSLVDDKGKHLIDTYLGCTLKYKYTCTELLPHNQELTHDRKQSWRKRSFTSDRGTTSNTPTTSIGGWTHTRWCWAAGTARCGVSSCPGCRAGRRWQRAAAGTLSPAAGTRNRTPLDPAAAAAAVRHTPPALRVGNIRTSSTLNVNRQWQYFLVDR